MGTGGIHGADGRPVLLPDAPERPEQLLELRPGPRLVDDQAVLRQRAILERAVRLRLKEAVFAANLRRALATLGAALPQVLIVGGPAGDDELLGVVLRVLPGEVPVGRASVGGTLTGGAVGHRYAAAVGLAMAEAGG